MVAKIVLAQAKPAYNRLMGKTAGFTRAGELGARAVSDLMTKASKVFNTQGAITSDVAGLYTRSFPSVRF